MVIRNLEKQTAFTTKDGSRIRSILDKANAPVQNQSLAEASLPAGGTTQRHFHSKSEEFYFVLEGTGRMEVDGVVRHIGPNDAVLIPPGAAHELVATTDIRFLCCCSPAYSHEDTVLFSKQNSILPIPPIFPTSPTQSNRRPAGLAATSNGIHSGSSPQEKIALFLSLFAGREDVFAKRWENAKKGTAGYAPMCRNEWSHVCPKAGGGKTMKCGECSNRKFVALDADAVEKHLKGQWTIGTYAMLPDETCRCWVFDFDSDDTAAGGELQRDVTAIREVCAERKISVAVERSRSGKGFHLWVFFVENIPAVVARKFGSSLISCAMNERHGLAFKTYDRLIPNQDTMPKGGFGGLVALPLQRVPRELGNSAFVDESFDVYADQWAFLHGVKKHTFDEIERFICELSPIGELGTLRKDEEEDEKPWKARKPAPEATRSDFPETVEIVRVNMLFVRTENISPRGLNALKRLAAFRNPEFFKAQAMRLSTFGKPRIISCADETEQYLCLPRGLENEVVELLKNVGVKIKWSNKTSKGRKIDVAFNGALRDEQQQAADALIAHDTGILSATTAFGKTVIGAHLIAQRKVNTLVLVHRTNLLAQWVERLGEFLAFAGSGGSVFDPTTLTTPSTPTIPKKCLKKISLIGQIGGGKNSPSGIVDVAVMQSLVSGDEVKELVKDYGMVIVDECHHVSAFSFEQILKTATAKYVYGLTATPTRQDGHHPIITMHCGAIRYRVDAKSQAEARPFEHFLIPRFTRFQKPTRQDEAKWTIVDIYRDLQNSEPRNELIVQDVVAAVEQGRNPIVLTERTEHVKTLAERLRPHVKNVIPMIGGTGRKQSREVLQAVAEIPPNESFALIATGRYVGEGFDMPRLDTLFLAMPVSWKGTVQQYAGRLHRLFEGKREVQIYDYVDVRVAMLERMYQKRLKGYSSIGYKAKGTPQPFDDFHSIYDSTNFFPVYSADILAARNEIIIVSPFLTKRRVLASLDYLRTAAAPVTLITKPPENYPAADRLKIAECVALLTAHGIAVKTKDRIHQKFAIMDQRLVWYGSINLLSYGTSEESIMRIESPDIAAELAGTVLKP